MECCRRCFEDPPNPSPVPDFAGHPRLPESDLLPDENPVVIGVEVTHENELVKIDRAMDSGGKEECPQQPPVVDEPIDALSRLIHYDAFELSRIAIILVFLIASQIANLSEIDASWSIWAIFLGWPVIMFYVGHIFWLFLKDQIVDPQTLQDAEALIQKLKQQNPKYEWKAKTPTGTREASGVITATDESSKFVPKSNAILELVFCHQFIKSESNYEQCKAEWLSTPGQSDATQQETLEYSHTLLVRLDNSPCWINKYVFIASYVVLLSPLFRFALARVLQQQKYTLVKKFHNLESVNGVGKPTDVKAVDATMS